MREGLTLNEKRLQKGMDLMTFCNKYLDYAERFTKRTYEEKKTLSRRIIKAWGSNTIVDQISSDMVLTYLDEQAKVRSTNASNKDRKNLLALWNWGQDILDLSGNPVAKTKKRPHDRKPQYTPPLRISLGLLPWQTGRSAYSLIAI